MGSGRYNSDDWAAVKSTRSVQSSAQLFAAHSHTAKSEFVPKNIVIRESLDSPDSPNSRPIYVAMDVTGSMLHIPEYMAKTGIGELMAGILKHQPVADPHVLIGTFADAKGDRYPLQVGQFEADNRVTEQAVQFYLGGGGDQDSESYDYPWLFAATCTTTDAWNKRGLKGYLFTTGDEPAPNRVNTLDELTRVFGNRFEREMTSQEMLKMAQEKWSVFHIIIEEGSRGKSASTQRSWTELLGPNALFLNDHRYLAELIVAVISVTEGKMSIEEAIEAAGPGKASVANAFARLAEFA